MTEYFKQILTAQFEAALSMLRYAIAACPPEHFEGKIASGSFRWVAYHTLFYVDFYLSTSEETFERRELHQRGGDERGDALNNGLDQVESLAFLDLCHQKMLTAIAAETSESLQGPSGFPWYEITRGEFHLNNIRHIQHHTGALYAYLRRVDKSFQEPVNPLPWIGSGWR
jgi:DinB superfamily